MKCLKTWPPIHTENSTQEGKEIGLDIVEELPHIV